MKFGNKLQKIIKKKKRNKSWKIARRNPNDVRIFIQWYYGAIAFVDSQVGRLIDTLKQEELYDNTIIVFQSDHGWHSGHNSLWCKNSLFELVTRVPLIIKGINDNSQKIEERAVELIDLFPTLNEMASLDKLEQLDGSSLFSNKENHYAFSQYPRCRSKTKIQDHACMFSQKNPCKNLPKIRFMGYSVRHFVDGHLYSYILWKPFKQTMKECRSLFPGTVGKFPIMDKMNSYTLWSEKSVDTMFFRDSVLYSDPELEEKYSKIIHDKFMKERV